MTAIASTPHFKANVHEALTDARLQGALPHARNFTFRRAAAAERLPEFEALRDSARAIKDHTLAHLDLYLEAYERKVVESGGHVHYAQDAEEARKIIIDLCKSLNARSVTKGKSMISEEIGLNAALEAAGMEAVETDLGEYIIQLRGEAPSHIIAPAIHVSMRDVEEEFRKAHRDLPADRDLSQPEQLLGEARAILRAKFLAADVGITGANFLIAETGTSVIVTNEGNGDLTQILPKAHIVIASIEKIVPTLEDASAVPARAGALGDRPGHVGLHDASRPGRAAPGDPDGPEEYHVVILDNGRSAMLGGEFEDMLRCIRCGACMNHCPVYQAIGGHAYGWVYPGPMGAVLTPAADRRRRGRPIAQRLDLLRALRGGLPGAHSAAQDDAPLARARVRAPPLAGAGALRPRVVGVLRQAAGALSAFDRPGDARDAPRRPAQGPLRLGAVRLRLDRLSRSRRAAGGDVPEPLARQERADAMNARETILASIRRSLAVTGAEAPRRLEVDTRLATAPAGVIPARGQGDLAARVATFKAEAERAQASVAEVASLDDLPAEVARYLRDNNLPASLRIGADATLAAAPWGATSIEILHGASDGHDLNALSHAFAGVAETGTLALASGADNPTTLNFLPDNHIVVVAREAIAGDYESVFARLREVFGKGVAPRTLNFITGPSRSADIEQTLLLGAHGPRKLHIVIVGA